VRAKTPQDWEEGSKETTSASQITITTQETNTPLPTATLTPTPTPDIGVLLPEIENEMEKLAIIVLEDGRWVWVNEENIPVGIYNPEKREASEVEEFVIDLETNSVNQWKSHSEAEGWYDI
jgi:hypothetical protein